MGCLPTPTLVDGVGAAISLGSDRDAVTWGGPPMARTVEELTRFLEAQNVAVDEDGLEDDAFLAVDAARGRASQRSESVSTK